MQSSGALPAAKKPAGWKVALNVLLLVALVGIFAWQVQKNWADIAAYQWNLDWGLAWLALGMLLLHSLCELLIWNYALGRFSAPLPFQKLVPVFIWSNLARYIPGKVASVVVRVALGTEAGRRPVVVFAASALELALRTAAALLVFLVTLPTWGGSTGVSPGKIAVSLVIIAIVAIGAHPRMMLPALNWTLKKINKAPIEQTLRYREVAGLFLAECARWVLYGLTYVVLACAIYPEARHAVIALIGVANASWAVGFLGVTPGGVAVSEWVQKFVLERSLGFPEGVAWILPVLARVWSLAAEGLWAMFAWVLRHHSTRQTDLAAPVPEVEQS